MLHLRYFCGALNMLWFQGYTKVSIKYFMIDIWQCSKYALDSEGAMVLNILGCTGFCVNCIYGILNVLRSEKVLNVSEV